jgi:hypothetical protein
MRRSLIGLMKRVMRMLLVRLGTKQSILCRRGRHRLWEDKVTDSFYSVRDVLSNDFCQVSRAPIWGGRQTQT